MTMPTMAGRNHRERQSVWVVFCLALSLGLQGCARSEPPHPSDASSPASAQKLPFHADTDQASAGGGALPAAPDPKQSASLPFRAAAHPHILPAGTLLTVQLEDSLSAAKVGAGDTFAASVAAPVVIDRGTVLEPGTAVTGRIESARSVPGSGYFRLTLNSITIGGTQLALQTSSLFARGTFQPSEGIGIQKGHRLTFRLTASFTVDPPNSAAKRQSLGQSLGLATE